METPRYIDVGGVKTRYFDSGQGEPMVLVHGGHFGVRGGAEDWDRNFDRLAQHHRVIAYDKLGMGFTDNPSSPDDYTIQAQAKHLGGLIEALDLDKVHLIGHSRGGYAVTRVALDEPDRVATLTIIASSSVTNPFNPVYAEWREQAAAMEEREAVRFLIRANSFSDDHISDRMVDVGVEVGRTANFAEAQRLMSGGLYDRFKEDLLERLEAIKEDIANGGLTMPTLLMWGFNDPSATIDRCGKPAIDQFFPVVEDCEMHILNRAGHYCFRERPEAFEGTLLDFIARHRD